MAHYQSEYGNVRRTDEYGNPVRTDEYGNPVRTDEYGNPMSHTDRYGNPIPSGDTAARYGTAGTNAGATGCGTTTTTTGCGATGHHGKEHHVLGRHRSGSSSSSSSEEEDEHGVRRKKGMKEKIPGVGGRGKDEYERDQTHMSTTTPGGGYAGEQHEKKGIMDKIKEKLPGGHNH